MSHKFFPGLVVCVSLSIVLLGRGKDSLQEPRRDAHNSSAQRSVHVLSLPIKLIASITSALRESSHMTVPLCKLTGRCIVNTGQYQTCHWTRDTAPVLTSAVQMATLFACPLFPSSVCFFALLLCFFSIYLLLSLFTGLLFFT